MALNEFKWCTQVQNGGGAMTVTNNDREVAFGNGYTQVASAGYNTERREYAIIYTGREWREVRNFLRDNRLKPFLWVAPDGIGLWLVVRDSLTLTPVGKDLFEVKASFREQFTSMS